MKQRTTVRAIAIAALVTLGLALPARAADPGISDNEILIGMFGPMSGPLTIFGVDAIQAAKMWYDEINKKGGIHGRKIRIQLEDDKCSPTEALTAVKKLISVDKVFLINGGACTATLVAVQEAVSREKIPLVAVDASGDPAVFPPTRYVFAGFGGTQHADGATLVEFAVGALKAKRIAYVGHDDDYGVASFAAVKAAAKRLGAELVEVDRFPRDVSDVTAPMLRVRAAKPDVIISTAYPGPAVLIAQKYGEYGMNNIPLLQGTGGIPAPGLFAKNIGNDEALKNFYFQWKTLEIVDAPMKQKWDALYKQYYPDRNPGPFMFAGLPAAMAITATLEKAGRDVTRESFIDAMETLDLKTGITVGNLVLSKTRHDAHRAAMFLKYDGKAMALQKGVYSWNGIDGLN